MYKHWAIAFSGGKDSSATVTLVVDLIENGKIPRPDSLTVLYADTRQELPPLHNAAMALMENLRERGFDTRVVLPQMESPLLRLHAGARGCRRRQNTFRWCTPKLKVMSMERELDALRQERGEKFFDAYRGPHWRIGSARSADCHELYQGWRRVRPGLVSADFFQCGGQIPLAPLLHWRVCHVWDWLVQADVELGFPTFDIAEVYGHDPQD